MKKLIHIILALCAALPVMANDRAADIIAIKKSPDFLSAEATMKTANEAMTVARDLLRDEIIRWTTDELKNPMDSVEAQRLSEKADTMTTERVDMMRVFVYIDKASVGAPTPAPVPETAIEPEGKNTLLSDSARQIILQRFSPKKTIVRQGVIRKMMRARNFFELKDVMEPLKKSGEITGYGKYATAQNPALCYLIVYDPAGNLVAWLGKGEENRKNLKTGKTESIRDYRGCGAIWFTINENNNE